MQFYQLRPTSTKDDKRSKRPRPSHFDSGRAEVVPLMDVPEASLDANPDRVILGSSWPRANSFVYWLLKSPDHAYRHVRNAAYKQFFYCVEPKRSVRCYLDLEATRRRDMPPERFLQVARRLVAYWCCYLDAAYMVNTGAAYDGHWHFYDATTRHKLSLHAYSSLTFLSANKLRTHMQRFQELLRHMHTQDRDPAVADFFYGPDQKCILDTSVYTKRRLFRLPFNAKSVDKRNWFRPVLDTDASRQMTREQHFYTGFVHPMPALHQMLIPMPRDPAKIGRRALAYLLDETRWPQPSLHAVSDVLATLADMYAAHYRVPPAPDGARDQLVSDPQVQAALDSLLLDGPAACADRHCWLVAVTAVFQIMGANSRLREEQMFEQLPHVLSAAHALSLGSTRLMDRVANMSRSVGLRLGVSDGDQDDTTRRGDPYMEYAFCAIQARMALFSRSPQTGDALHEFASMDAQSDERQQDFPFGEDECRRRYEVFRRTPAALLCAPPQPVTLDRVARLSHRGDPLSSGDTARRPSRLHDPDLW